MGEPGDCHRDPGRCPRTVALPLAGAAPRGELARLEQPRRLVRRQGAGAALVLDVARSATGWTEPDLLAPVAEGCPVTTAELVSSA